MTSRRVRGLYFMRESSPVQPVVQAEAPACPRVHSLRGLHPKRGHTARPHVASFRPRTHPLCLPPHARADASAPSTLLPPPLHLLALTEARTLALAAHAASLWGSFTLGQLHFGAVSLRGRLEAKRLSRGLVAQWPSRAHGIRARRNAPSYEPGAICALRRATPPAHPLMHASPFGCDEKHLLAVIEPGVIAGV